MGKGGKNETGDKLDDEIDVLLASLSEIQDKVGGPKKEEAKINPAFKDDEFLLVKDNVMDQLKEGRRLLSKNATEAETMSGTEKGKVSNDLRKCFREANDMMAKLDQLQTSESRKKKSKFTDEELAKRKEIVNALSEEIEELKFAYKGGNAAAARPVNSLLNMEDHDIFKKAPEQSGGPGVKYEQEAVSSEQRQELQQIQQRKDQFDNQIDIISQGVDQLQDKAMTMKEQVEVTTEMIVGLGEQVDSAQEKLLNVNEKLKGTLDEVTRGEGKCCMDIICLLLLLGLVAVAIQVFRDSS
mmetsp:Transcript_82876/g.234139  ORF Transcript_82876/g.234139 Transcript_82876/m.234139 type:complete len:298 (-) Transcript_82876:181-1074(-)